ncbi:hypothetical protein Bca101_077786 [Brassica carinata]
MPSLFLLFVLGRFIFSTESRSIDSTPSINQTELTEPPPLSRSNVPANLVSLPPYRSNIIIPFDAKPCFLVIFISQSVQSPLRNINSPFGFHGAVNLSSDSNKRFVYDVGAYNSDDGKADQNVNSLIGKGGEIADLNSALRPVEIIGNLASIEKAEKLINEVIAQVGVIIGRGNYQEHADKVESTDSGCPFYL